MFDSLQMVHSALPDQPPVLVLVLAVEMSVYTSSDIQPEIINMELE